MRRGRKFLHRVGNEDACSSGILTVVDGLVEGTNKLLLYILARLCAPELGEDGWNTQIGKISHDHGRPLRSSHQDPSVPSLARCLPGMNSRSRLALNFPLNSVLPVFRGL